MNPTGRTKDVKKRYNDDLRAMPDIGTTAISKKKARRLQQCCLAKEWWENAWTVIGTLGILVCFIMAWAVVSQSTFHNFSRFNCCT